MNGLSTLTAIPAPVIIAALAIVATGLLVSRTLLWAAAAGAVGLAAWRLDLPHLVQDARSHADKTLALPVDQLHVAHFGLGLMTGLIVFSTLFFVRAFAKAALVVATFAIAYVLATESVPGLVRCAGAALHFLQEFDFFTKGLVAGKFLAGLIKWKQIRRRTGVPS